MLLTCSNFGYIDGKSFSSLLWFCMYVARVWLIKTVSRRLDSDLWHGWWYQTLQCTSSQVRLLTFSALTLLVRRQEGHPACKKTERWNSGMVIIWAEVQICIWHNWCHCHSLSLAPVNPDWFYLSGVGLPEYRVRLKKTTPYKNLIIFGII